MACYKFNGVKLDELELHKRLIQALDENPELANLATAIYSNVDYLSVLKRIIAEKNNELIKNTTSEDWLGFTEYIHSDRNDARFTVWLPNYNTTNQRLNFIIEYCKKHVGEANVEQKAQEAWEQTELDRYIISTQGTFGHYLIEATFSDEQHSNSIITTEPTSEKWKSAKYSLINTLKLPEHKKFLNFFDHQGMSDEEFVVVLVDKLADIAIDVHNRLINTYHPKFVTAECTIYNSKEIGSYKNFQLRLPSAHQKKKGIKGRMDLVFVDENDKIHVVDYKFSNNSPDNWDDAKKQSVYALLAGYRAMLASKHVGEKGKEFIKESDIILDVIPIKMDKGLYSTMRIADECIIDDKFSSQINWTNTINNSKQSVNAHLYIYLANEIQAPHVTTQTLKEINLDLSNIFGDRLKELETAQLTVDSLWAHIKNETSKLPKRKNNQGEQLFRFKNYIENKVLWLTEKELFGLQEGHTQSFLERYVALYNQYRLSDIINIVSVILDYINSNNSNLNDLKFYKDLADWRNEPLRRYFAKFLNGLWEILNIPELFDLNIICFKSRDPKNPTISVVALTNLNISTTVEPYEIGINKNIAGNYVSDRDNDVRTEKYLESTGLNIIAAKVLLAINRLKSKPNTNIFQDANGNNLTISSIDLMRINTHEVVPYNLDLNVLASQCSKLINMSNEQNGTTIPNTFKKQKMVGGIERQCASTLEKLWADIEESNDILWTKNTSLQKRFTDAVQAINNNPTNLATVRSNIYIMLNSLRSLYRKFENITVDNISNLSDNDPVEHLFKVLLNTLFEIDAHYRKAGELNTPGFSFDLRTLFNRNNKNLKSGIKDVGFLGGQVTTAQTNTPNDLVFALTESFDAACSSIRDRHMKAMNMQKKTSREWKAQIYAGRIMIGAENPNKRYSRFFVTNADGSIASELRLINPYKDDCNLTDVEKEYLQNKLWEINVWKPNNSDIKPEYRKLTWEQFKTAHPDVARKIMQYDSTDEWFLLPLARSSVRDQILGNITNATGDVNYAEAFKNYWQNQKFNFETVGAVEGHTYSKKITKLFDIPHLYRLGIEERSAILDANPDLNAFTFDLDYIAADMAYQTIKEEEFQPLVYEAAGIFLYINELEEELDEDARNIREQLTLFIDINIKGLSIIKDEYLPVLKGVSVFKSMNSKLLLMFRPARFFAECLYGLTVALMRCITMHGSSNEYSLQDLMKAQCIVTGLTGKNGINLATGQIDPTCLNVLQSINKLYGFAMEDISRLVQNNTNSKYGIEYFGYQAYQLSDFLNRMTLVVAKMLHDGTWDAHEMIDGELVYDWKKDKRFSLLATYGLNNSNIKDTEYLKQRSMYLKIAEELLLETKSICGTPIEYVTWDASKKLFILKDIDKCYTVKQRMSIKECADLVYGAYDKEAKAPYMHKMTGIFFSLFLTFITSIWNRWGATKAFNTKQGLYKYKTDENGNLLMKKPVLDKDGNLTGEYIEIPENELTDAERMACSYVVEFGKDYFEGYIYSFLHTFKDLYLFLKNPEDLKQRWKATNYARLRNLLAMFLELLIGVIGCLLFKAAASDGTGRLKNMNLASKVVYTAMSNYGPLALGETSFTPSFISMLHNLSRDSYHILMGTTTFSDFANNRIGAFKDFVYDID